MTFAEYMLLTDAEKVPIDDIVRERTAGRLMIKNSLNKRLREYLVQTFSVSNNTCYPNTISDAVSLLTTFKQGGDASNDNTSKDDAVVSYHKTDANVLDDNGVVETDAIDETAINADTFMADNNVELDDSDELNNSDTDIDNIDHDNDKCISHVTFNESVMASIVKMNKEYYDCKSKC
jgi:hypothetical protein